ncbi:MAG TPA: hypothetical protein PLJ71_05335 [Candidatus Hydrogenedentes bacterium]|nr:hypothetical protein [Candidatus Hydrogenedentota bacterium]HQM48088.1 hypothetical protein [Candidatus Hydrogenedentota bacterium]
MYRVLTPLFRPLGACALMALIFAPAACAWACEGLTVGLALFQNRRDMHSLLVIGPEKDPQTQELYDNLVSWSRGAAEDLNLSPLRIASGDPAVVWSDHGFQEPPDAARAVYLVARHPASGLSLIVDRWDHAPTAEDLEVLRESPLRERLRHETVANLAVIVHSPGADTQAAANTRALLQEIVAAWKNEQGQNIALLTLDRSDPRERTLVHFAKLNETDAEWAAVFAGRGTMLFPPLEGEALTRENLSRLLEKLAGPCTCIENPYALGVEIPTLWTDADDKRASELAPPLYTEQVVGEPREATVTGSETPAVPSVLALGGIAAGIMCIVSLGAVAAVLWQYRRRSHAPTEEA